jgi:hypothetical protein
MFLTFQLQALKSFVPPFYRTILAFSVFPFITYCSWNNFRIRFHQFFPNVATFDISVSDYGLDDRAIGVRSPAGAEDFSSSLYSMELAAVLQSVARSSPTGHHYVYDPPFCILLQP